MRVLVLENLLEDVPGREVLDLAGQDDGRVVGLDGLGLGAVIDVLFRPTPTGPELYLAISQLCSDASVTWKVVVATAFVPPL